MVLKEVASAWSKADSLFLAAYSRLSCLYGPRVYSCYLSVFSAVNVIDSKTHWIGFYSLVSRIVSDILVGLTNTSSEETLYNPALVEDARRKTSPRQNGGQKVCEGFAKALKHRCSFSFQGVCTPFCKSFRGAGFCVVGAR